MKIRANCLEKTTFSGCRTRDLSEATREAPRVARPEAFSIMDRSTMDMTGATIPAAQEALSRSVLNRNPRCLVFHSS